MRLDNTTKLVLVVAAVAAAWWWSRRKAGNLTEFVDDPGSGGLDEWTSSVPGFEPISVERADGGISTTMAGPVVNQAKLQARQTGRIVRLPVRQGTQDFELLVFPDGRVTSRRVGTPPAHVAI